MPIQSWDKNVIFWILGSNFLGGLNQKSTSQVICKIHIYIDSDNFRKIHFKCWENLYYSFLAVSQYFGEATFCALKE